jgi:hypothetical protein
MTQAFEICDILIDIFIGHFESSDFVLGLLMLCIIDECTLEFAFQDFPGRGVIGKDGWVTFRVIEPVVRPLDPSICFRFSY